MSARTRGRTPTEAEYRARGLVVVKVRLPEDYVARMDQMADDLGFSRADMVRGWIDSEWAELEAIAATRNR